MSFIIIKITCPDMLDAKRITSYLIEKKYISGAHYFPVKSISSWSGTIEEVDEVICFLKTRTQHWGLLKNEIISIHSYDVPCITKFEVEANESYEAWIRKQTLQ